MNVLYIWDADYPWDVRVEKICGALSADGHAVHIAARNLKRRPVVENINGITVHRIKTYKHDRVNYTLSFPLFFSPIWKRFLDGAVKQEKIDLVIVRDLPMAIAAIWLGQRHSIPVIFDMAEDYVSMVRDIWRKRKFQGLNLIVRNPYLAGLVEKYALKRFDEILVVVEEAKDVVVRGGGNSERITVVSNTPEEGKLLSVQSTRDPFLESMASRFTVIYTGGLQLGRGIQTVLEAIPRIIDSIPDFLFVVVGDGYAGRQLKEMACSLGIEKHVGWVGWVEHSKLASYLLNSKIGLIPHFASSHTNTTVPNKLFDYMGLGLPVIASDLIPIKRILKEENAGVVYPSGNSQALADAVIRMRDSVANYGESGHRAFKEKYNWSLDAFRLVSLVKKYSGLNAR